MQEWFGLSTQCSGRSTSASSPTSLPDHRVSGTRTKPGATVRAWSFIASLSQVGASSSRRSKMIRQLIFSVKLRGRSRGGKSPVTWR